MTTGRVIKKYPNRRLYDTEESRYITLADIRDLVLNKAEFLVIDKKTGQDITRSILLQVIIEQEQQCEPIMSEKFLSQVVCTYGKAAPGLVAGYLEQSLKLFLAQQQQASNQVTCAPAEAEADPVSAVSELAQSNFNRWRTLQDEMLRRFASAARTAADESVEAPGEDRKKVG